MAACMEILSVKHSIYFVWQKKQLVPHPSVQIIFVYQEQEMKFSHSPKSFSHGPVGWAQNYFRLNSGHRNILIQNIITIITFIKTVIFIIIKIYKI